MFDHFVGLAPKGLTGFFFISERGNVPVACWVLNTVARCPIQGTFWYNLCYSVDCVKPSGSSLYLLVHIQLILFLGNVYMVLNTILNYFNAN